jgi:hypothetical protein
MDETTASTLPILVGGDMSLSLDSGRCLDRPTAELISSTCM